MTDPTQRMRKILDKLVDKTFGLHSLKDKEVSKALAELSKLLDETVALHKLAKLLKDPKLVRLLEQEGYTVNKAALQQPNQSEETGE